MKKWSQKQSAFTLLEMSIVLFIISLLILIILPNVAQQRKNADRIHQRALTSVVQTQVDSYANDTGKNNVTLEQLQKSDYLTSSQVKKARQEHITIVGGKVVQR